MIPRSEPNRLGAQPAATDGFVAVYEFKYRSSIVWTSVVGLHETVTEYVPTILISWTVSVKSVPFR